MASLPPQPPPPPSHFDPSFPFPFSPLPPPPHHHSFSFSNSTPPASTVLRSLFFYLCHSLPSLSPPPRTPPPFRPLLSLTPSPTLCVGLVWLILELRAICRRRWNSSWGLIQTLCLTISLWLMPGQWLGSRRCSEPTKCKAFINTACGCPSPLLSLSVWLSLTTQRDRHTPQHIPTCTF